MRKKICLLFVTGLAALPGIAQTHKHLYPFTPMPVAEIRSKISYLSEDSKPLQNIYEIDQLGLSKANAKNKPWSGPFWNFKQGMIANPYQDRTIFQFVHYIPTVDDIKPYAKRRNYIMTNEAQLTEEELAKLAPSEKYDILLGNQLDLTTRIWDYMNKWNDDMKWNFMTSIDIPDGHEIDKKRYIVANWEGICHGWAPASGVIPKPEKTVAVTLPDGRVMPFYPEDIKGLISLTWANSLVQDNVLSEGIRCREPSPRKDKYGRLYDTVPEAGEVLSRCADVHPGVMHLALANITGKQGRSFVLDKNVRMPVANQPVVGYEFKYFHPDNGEDLPLSEALTPYRNYRARDPFHESRQQGIEYIVGVESTITYADWTKIKNPGTRDYLKDHTAELISLYDLELDKAGNIIGGQWRGFKDLNIVDELDSQRLNNLMNTNRPDFMWAVPKNYKDYFKPIAGLEKWDIRSGTPAPTSWKKASVAAHSFEYFFSKAFNNYEYCKVKDADGRVKEVICEFKYPKPQPLLQVVDQLIEFSKR